MSNFNPEKLSVTYIPPATTATPLVGRKYTLTHSDLTAQLFLSIGFVYDFQAIDQKMRDEVIAQWHVNLQGGYVLAGRAYISGGEFDQLISARRFDVFQKEMATALRGMVYGDRDFYSLYPIFLDAPIYIYYDSIYPQFGGTFYYGTPRKYLEGM